MFKNIGGKIKAYAKVICIIGIVISCLAGLIIILGSLASSSMVMRSGYNSYVSNAAAGTAVIGIISGVLVAGLGTLFSWLSTFLLYGFGQQVQMQEESANSLAEIRMLLQGLTLSQPPAAPAPQPPAKPAPVPQPAPVEPPAPVEAAPVEPAVPVCPQCGTQLGQDSAFCPGCGSKV